MKEENKLRSSVDSTEEDVRLHRKKTDSDQSEVGGC
jgi:hypothetical protein